MYLLYDKDTGDYYGEYESVEEAVGCAACLHPRDYYLTTSFKEGREMVLNTTEFKEALRLYWENVED